jgi:hypothetical protein
MIRELTVLVLALIFALAIVIALALLAGVIW